MTQAPELGDPSLDADHAKLAHLVEALAGASAESVLAALDALRAHAAVHFAVEDQELREMKDGNASCHLDEHAAVLKSLDEVGRIVTTDPASRDSQVLVDRLVGELRRWLPEHVQAMDAGVANFRSKRRLGGSPLMIARRSSAVSG